MAIEGGSAYGTGRVTPQRAHIARTAEAIPGAFTVDDLEVTLRDSGSTVGMATVYRAVSAMVSSGWLERVGERDGSALFARCHAGDHHHHHVVCDGCGRVEATACPVAAPRDASRSGGFVVTRHEMTLYGLCPSCAAEGKAGGRV